jgi:hypothetical protein
MRKSLFAAVATVAVLLLSASADRAAAMTGATPTQLGLATADNSLVQKAALVCGRWGCRRIWRGPRVVWGPRRVWWGPRPLFAYAGPSWGWSNSSWAWSSPPWGWSSWSGPSWGWSGPWAWRRPWWGWERW